MASMPALDPDKATLKKTSNKAKCERTLRILFSTFSKLSKRAKGNNIACTAAKPAGFSNVPVMGNE